MEGLEPANQILALISKEGADAVFDLDESLRIVTDTASFNVINNVSCREDVRICLQGVFGYKGSLDLFVFCLRLSRASVMNSPQEGVIEEFA